MRLSPSSNLSLTCANNTKILPCREALQTLNNVTGFDIVLEFHPSVSLPSAADIDDGNSWLLGDFPGQVTFQAFPEVSSHLPMKLKLCSYLFVYSFVSICFIPDDWKSDRSKMYSDLMSSSSFYSEL